MTAPRRCRRPPGGAQWAIVPAAPAWGLALHDLGDVVTPAALPLLWPLREGPVRLPRAVARHGEQLAAGAAPGHPLGGAGAPAGVAGGGGG